MYVSNCGSPVQHHVVKRGKLSCLLRSVITLHHLAIVVYCFLCINWHTSHSYSFCYSWLWPDKLLSELLVSEQLPVSVLGVVWDDGQNGKLVRVQPAQHGCVSSIVISRIGFPVQLTELKHSDSIIFKG